MINKKTLTAIAQSVQDVISKPITDAGYTLWDVEFINEGGAYNLLITIDNAAGISLCDCETVTRLIDPIIDSLDPIEESYFLEVSSPGCERLLRTDAHLEAYLQKSVLVGLFSPLQEHPELKKTLRATLVAFDDVSFTLKLKDKDATVVIERKKCSTIKADDFDTVSLL